MRRAMRLVLSLVYWGLFALSAIAIFPIALLVWLATRPFDRRGVALHAFTSGWAALYTVLNPAWRVHVSGRERFRPDQTYVVVANHQSLLDILVLFRLFRHFRWVSKIENFRIPIVGWVMRMNRYVELERGKAESVRRMLRACEQALAEGNSLLIFPEGTRSESGALRPFKTGAFELARNARCPILPVVIDGTSKALPKHGIVLQGRHSIRVEVLDEIAPESFEGLNSSQLAEKVREQIAKALAR
jgi:1-acyl-sn-glycerol-3-phosphate acyltransferase